MKKFIVALIVVALLAIVGLLATSEGADKYANESQKLSTILK